MKKISKIDKTVLKETLFVSVWILIFSCIMQSVFLIIGKWDYTVLLGNLLSGVMGCVNFLLLGLTVQKALASQDVKYAKSLMKASQALRLLMMVVVAIIGAVLPCFNLWATLIPILFPRLSMIARQISLRNQGGGQGYGQGDGSSNEPSDGSSNEPSDGSSDEPSD